MSSGAAVGPLGMLTCRLEPCSSTTAAVTSSWEAGVRAIVPSLATEPSIVRSSETLGPGPPRPMTPVAALVTTPPDGSASTALPLPQREKGSCSRVIVPALAKLAAALTVVVPAPPQRSSPPMASDWPAARLPESDTDGSAVDWSETRKAEAPSPPKSIDDPLRR